MSRAALLAAALIAPGAHPASIDFGLVELGDAARRVLRVSALEAEASGAGFSAAPARGRVVIVFEPYELHEEATGVLTLRTSSGLVRIGLRGRGVDTIAPSVTVSTRPSAHAGRPLTIHVAATDNDLVGTCTLSVDGHVIGRLLWPASTFRWLVPSGRRRFVRVTVVARDRAGNRASATSRAIVIR